MKEIIELIEALQSLNILYTDCCIYWFRLIELSTKTIAQSCERKTGIFGLLFFAKSYHYQYFTECPSETCTHLSKETYILQNFNYVTECVLLFFERM